MAIDGTSGKQDAFVPVFSGDNCNYPAFVDQVRGILAADCNPYKWCQLLITCIAFQKREAELPWPLSFQDRYFQKGYPGIPWIDVAVRTGGLRFKLHPLRMVVV